MVFSSLVFLTAFLPFALLAGWGLSALLARIAPPGSAWRWAPVNALLLALSLAFYAYGEGGGVAWLAASLVFNDAAARLLHRLRSGSVRKAALAVAIAANLALLGWFKYAGFLATTLNLLPGVAIPVPEIALPLGISFYTFQAMSYVIDVYRGDVEPAHTPLDFGCYLTMFPQLVAGPIVRYADIAAQVRSRSIDADRTGSGMRRFLAGLAKKAILANSFAEFADAAWAMADQGLTLPCPLAWLALVAYALQIYFDFSGYSDMAIGIGRMLGFDFPENFLHPYAATSVRDFWRRWHVSLSTWFRDYLYIPLGGNRRGMVRTCLNGLVVFALCGLWHGAGVMFLLWGLWHGLFLTLERVRSSVRNSPRHVASSKFQGPRSKVQGARSESQEATRNPQPATHNPPWRRFAGRIYATAVFLFGWLLFRSETFGAMRAMLRSLAGAAPDAEARALYIDASPGLLVLVVVGLVLSQPGLLPNLRPTATSQPGARALAAQWAVLTVLGLLSLLLVAGGSYNSFIYFRF